MGEVDKIAGFEIVKLVKKRHDCVTPGTFLIEKHEMGAGTVIRCETCGVNHRLEDSEREGWVWVREMPSIEHGG